MSSQPPGPAHLRGRRLRSHDLHPAGPADGLQARRLGGGALPFRAPVHHPVDPRYQAQGRGPRYGSVPVPLPVGRHWSLVVPMRGSDLTEQQQEEAAQHRDAPVP